MVFLVSGSDYSKIQEQVPQHILENCEGIYGCSGAEYCENDIIVYRKKHLFPDDLLIRVKTYIKESPYEFRHGNHIEHRPGMLNVSVVGRDATKRQRQHYHAWDLAHNERSSFAEQLNREFPNYETTCGGEISIDIVPSGWNKSVVKQEVLEKFPGSELIFFGDKMGAQGNDRPLAEALQHPDEPHRAVAVQDFEDTWKQLLDVSSAG